MRYALSAKISCKSAEMYYEMRLDSEKRFSFKTLLVTIACIIGAGTGTFLLYQDLNAGGAGGRGTPMATLEKREAKVRRKPAASFVWQSAQVNETLYRKESIQTGEHSAAVLKLNNGSQLDIGENSLIILDNVSDLSLNFLQGSVTVQDSSGQNRRITIDKDGKKHIENLPYRLIAPEALAHFFVTPKTEKSVEFSWSAKAPDPAAKPLLQISTDKNFKSDATQTLEITEPSGKLTAKLKPGLYFWRISDRAAVVSDVQRFALLPALPLKPLWPIEGQRVERWVNDTSVQFHWLSPRENSNDDEDQPTAVTFGRHEIEVSADPEFQNSLPPQSVNQQTGLATRNGIPDGTLYWRIKSQYGDLAVTSPTQTFVIEKLAEIKLDLAKPEDESAVELKPPTRFSWSCNANNIGFRWELQTPDGKSVETVKTQASSYVWKNSVPGRYRWRVVALVGEQTAGTSPWRELSIFKGTPLVLKTPAKDDQIYYWEKPVEFKFSWDKDLTAAESGAFYEVDLSSDPTFKNKLRTEKTTDTDLPSSRLALGNGNYFWRVRVVNSTGQTLKVSESFKFAYGLHPPLRAPASITPNPGEEINILEKEKLPVISWTPVEGAQNYDVTIYKLPSERNSKRKEVLHETTDQNSLTLKDFEVGNYQWTVRAVDTLKRLGDKTETQGFVLTYGAVLQPPETVSPEVQ